MPIEPNILWSLSKDEIDIIIAANRIEEKADLDLLEWLGLNQNSEFGVASKQQILLKQQPSYKATLRDSMWMRIMKR